MFVFKRHGDIGRASASFCNRPTNVALTALSGAQPTFALLSASGGEDLKAAGRVLLAFT